jgi:hypothetical protein
MTTYVLLWKVLRLVERHPGRYFFAQHVAVEIQISWLEADLALRYWTVKGRIFRRDDGRYILKPKETVAA